jgi:polysaccharide export outer membrane protein
MKADTSNRRSTALLLGLITILACSPVQAQDSEPVLPYIINPGDLLSVVVWKEEDLQRQVLVRPDGAFSFPLAGEIQATGKSVAQVQDELAAQLSRYIPDPVVTIAVEQILGNRIYVIGQVNRPGEFIASGRIDVVQALSLAGGFTPFAQKNDILILRRRNGIVENTPFRYNEIEKGKNLAQNIILQPGDAIVVP